MSSVLSQIFDNSQKNLSYYYLFDISDKTSEKSLQLTNNNLDIYFKNTKYSCSSNLQITQYLKTDSGADLMEISGIFSANGVSKEMSITNLEVQIILTDGRDSYPFARMFVRSSRVISEKFIWTLEPITLGLKNNMVNKFYSKSCRVAFCSKDCGLLLNDYTHIFLAYRITNNYITFEETIKPYLIGGRAIFSGERFFSAKIIDINDKIVVLDTKIPESNYHSIKLVASCNKSFTVCKEVYNNIINFRGEPYIPELDKFRIK